MRQKRVLRYYCDHCNKGGCSKPAMRLHESICTLNTARVCRMCRMDEEVAQAESSELVAAALIGLGAAALATTHGWFPVWIGTTFGMVLSDGLAVWAGRSLGKKIPEALLRWIAAGLFFFFGFWYMVKAVSAVR